MALLLVDTSLLFVCRFACRFHRRRPPTTADDRADSTADDRRRPCRFKISDQYFARRQAAAESAAETVRPSGSPSPVRPTRPARPGANVATGNILADADAAFTVDLNDEPANADAHADVAGLPVDSRHIEKAAWAMMDKAEMKLGLHKGKFSVLRLYANPAIRSKYPIHCILALVVYGAVHNEADCERTFAFSGSYQPEPKPRCILWKPRCILWSGSRWDGYYLDINPPWFVPRHDS